MTAAITPPSWIRRRGGRRGSNCIGCRACKPWERQQCVKRRGVECVWRDAQTLKRSNAPTLRHSATPQRIGLEGVGAEPGTRTGFEGEGEGDREILRADA